MNQMSSAVSANNGIGELSFEEIESVSGGYSESGIYGNPGGFFFLFPPNAYFDPNLGIFVYR